MTIANPPGIGVQQTLPGTRSSLAVMGMLRFSFGTMGSGKSTLALQIHHNLRARGLTTIPMTQLDRSEGRVSSRLGVSADAEIVESGTDLVVKDTHHHSAVTRAFLTNTDWNLIRTCPVPLWLVKPNEFDATPAFVAAIDPMHEHDKPAALDDEILQLSKLIGERVSGDVHAFHSYDPRIAVATATANAYIPVSLPFDEIEQQMHEDHEKRFNEITSFHGLDDDHSHLVAGLTHEELPAIANNLKADVVVMGAVARNRWKRLFIGATAERTLEDLPCDLLIIKPDWFQTPVEQHTHEAA